MLKILYFGVFEKPYDTEVYIANTLESMGHMVKRVNTAHATEDAVRVQLQADYDVILFSKGWFRDGEDREIRAMLKRDKRLKVGWFWDLSINTRREWQIHTHPLFQADIVFTTDGGHDKEYAALGVKRHITLRQGIYEPEAYIAKVDPAYAHDVVFVGTSCHDEWFGWDHRRKLLDWLTKTYDRNFAWYGGKGKEIRNAQLNTLYASAKVVIGDSVFSPYYWSNRVYETIGRGGFLLFPEIPGFAQEFTPYKHFIPYQYGDFEGIKEKIDYFVRHDAERDVIRRAGFDHAKAHHTYRHRCEQLIKEITPFL